MTLGVLGKLEGSYRCQRRSKCTGQKLFEVFIPVFGLLLLAQPPVAVSAHSISPQVQSYKYGVGQMMIGWWIYVSGLKNSAVVTEPLT